MRLAGRHGVFAEPAAAAALAGVVAAIDSKMIGPHDRVLVMITGSGLKDTKNAIRAGGRPIAIEPDVAAVAEQLKQAFTHKGHKSRTEAAEDAEMVYQIHLAVPHFLRLSTSVPSAWFNCNRS